MEFWTKYRGWIILLTILIAMVTVYFYLKKEDGNMLDDPDKGKEERLYNPMT